jgi:hypothetical protein
MTSRVAVLRRLIKNTQDLVDVPQNTKPSDLGVDVAVETMATAPPALTVRDASLNEELLDGAESENAVLQLIDRPLETRTDVFAPRCEALKTAADAAHAFEALLGAIQGCAAVGIAECCGLGEL